MPNTLGETFYTGSHNQPAPPGYPIYGLGVYPIGDPSNPLPVTLGSGSISLSGTFPSTFELSGTQVSGGALSVTSLQPSNCNLYQYAYAPAAFVVLSASNRISYKIFNNSNGIVYLSDGNQAASLSAWSEALGVGLLYTSDYPSFTGQISAIWDPAATTGTLMVTEYFQ